MIIGPSNCFVLSENKLNSSYHRKALGISELTISLGVWMSFWKKGTIRSWLIFLEIMVSECHKILVISKHWFRLWHCVAHKKPLPEPMLTQFFDTYAAIRKYVLMKVPIGSWSLIGIFIVHSCSFVRYSVVKSHPHHIFRYGEYS